MINGFLRPIYKICKKLTVLYRQRTYAFAAILLVTITAIFSGISSLYPDLFLKQQEGDTKSSYKNSESATNPALQKPDSKNGSRDFPDVTPSIESSINSSTHKPPFTFLKIRAHKDSASFTKGFEKELFSADKVTLSAEDTGNSIILNSAQKNCWHRP